MNDFTLQNGGAINHANKTAKVKKKYEIRLRRTNAKMRS